jgi:hypothetical protein
MRVKLAFLLSLFSLLSPATLLAHDEDEQRNSRAPVLLVEINNRGNVLLMLTVYDDGEAILARKDEDAPNGEICSSIVPAADLEVLGSTLRAAGALRLPDVDPVPNSTRKTVSFFIGADEHSRTHGNTFSYSKAEGPYLTVAQAISKLISNNFQNCF